LRCFDGGRGRWRVGVVGVVSVAPGVVAAPGVVGVACGVVVAGVVVAGVVVAGVVVAGVVVVGAMLPAPEVVVVVVVGVVAVVVVAVVVVAVVVVVGVGVVAGVTDTPTAGATASALQGSAVTDSARAWGPANIRPIAGAATNSVQSDPTRPASSRETPRLPTSKGILLTVSSPSRRKLSG
jgi:hypothetical protein